MLGQEIPFESILNMRKAIFNLPLDNSKQVNDVATLIQQLYWAYLHIRSLRNKEANEVANDAAMKLLVLAASNNKLSIRKRLSLLYRALRLSPSLIWSINVIFRCLRKAWKIMARRV
jgi:hypothetical protein